MLELPPNKESLAMAEKLVEDATSVNDPYKAFFLEMWQRYCDHEIDFDAGDDICQLALKLGLAEEALYDPDVHGESMGEEWGIEKGDGCYILAKENKS